MHLQILILLIMLFRRLVLIILFFLIMLHPLFLLMQPLLNLNSIRANCVTITNLAVVEDPTRTWNSCTQTGNVDGSWTFKTIMKQLASKDPAHIATDAQISDFVKNWLSNWASDQVINGD